MKIPIGTATTEIIIKRSRFIGGAQFFDNPETVKDTIGEIRERYAGCNHVAYAFITGANGEVSGMSDDREPRGTAGRPMLEILKGFELTNTLVTVVRYFGGTKLGTGGLVRAYSESARTALGLLKTEELIEKLFFCVRLPYSLYEPALRLFEKHSVWVEGDDFGELVTVNGKLPAVNRADFEKDLADLSGGAVSPDFSPV